MHKLKIFFSSRKKIWSSSKLNDTGSNSKINKYQMMPSRYEAVEKHVPAWKKLGLKLKYAREEPSPELNLQSAEIIQVEIANDKKRKSLAQDTSITSWKSPTKKAKKSASIKSSLSTKNTTPPRPSKPTSSPATTPKTNASEKRKSVSFTPETKTKDGDSTKQLFTTWLNSHLSTDPSFDPSSAPDALKYITPTSVATPTSPTPSNPKKPKKPKKPKSQKTVLTPSEPTGTSTPSSPGTSSTDPKTPVLNYLQTYHTTPNVWKFSKSRQTQLLRQVFSTTAIPPTYEPALHSYLRGLNDGAAAKQRLRMAAFAVRAEDDEWLKGLVPDDESQRRRKEEYENALRRLKAALREDRGEEGLVAGDEVTRDEEWRAHYLKRKRAETILWTLGSTPAALSSTTPALALTTTKPKTTEQPLRPRPKKRRKRKQRTGVPDDDDTSSSSSSSSSSSDSSSDSEEDAGRQWRGKGMGKKAVVAVEETSDSGSDSDETETETETETSSEGGSSSEDEGGK